MSQGTGPIGLPAVAAAPMAITLRRCRLGNIDRCLVQKFLLTPQMGNQVETKNDLYSTLRMISILKPVSVLFVLTSGGLIGVRTFIDLIH